MENVLIKFLIPLLSAKSYLCSFFIICRNWQKKSKVSFVHERVKCTNTPQAKISSINDSQTMEDYGPCKGNSPYSSKIYGVQLEDLVHTF